MSESLSLRFTDLIKLDILRLINSFKYGGLSNWMKTAVFGMLTLLFILIELDVSRLLFNNIMRQQYLEELRFVLLSKLIYMVFLVFSALLVYSNIVLAISVFFLSPEIDLIFMRPIGKPTFFLYRIAETFIQSSWMFIAFGTPILVSYGVVLRHGWEFIVPLSLVIIPILVLPSAIGTAAAIVLILIFSPKRTQRVLVVIGVCLAVGLVMIFRWMTPQQIIDPIGVEQLAIYLETLRVPMLSWLPVTWAAEALSAAGESRLFSGEAWNLVYLWSAAIGSIGIAYAVFHFGWFRARSGGRGSEVAAISNIRKRRRSLPRKFRMGFLYRDALLFVRDPSQWSQIIIIAALVIIYIYNFKNLPYALYGFQYSMAYVSVGASGLILAALLARFAYPAISIEGNAFQLIQSAPISWKRFITGKFIFYLVPTLLIAFLLVFFSLRVLDANLNLTFRCLLAIFTISIGCTAMAVGLGALFPQFNSPDPAKIAVSAGGLFFMFASIGFIGLVIFLTVFPDLIGYFSFYSRFIRSVQEMNRVYVWVPIIGVTTLVVYISLKLAIRAMTQYSQDH